MEPVIIDNITTARRTYVYVPSVVADYLFDATNEMMDKIFNPIPNSADYYYEQQLIANDLTDFCLDEYMISNPSEISVIDDIDSVNERTTVIVEIETGWK